MEEPYIFRKTLILIENPGIFWKMQFLRKVIYPENSDFYQK